jgi:hypothetical protein
MWYLNKMAYKQRMEANKEGNLWLPMNNYFPQPKAKKKEREYGEYEILFQLKHALVEYDPSSNRPFMVYEGSEGEWNAYSGEDTLETAKEVARERNKAYAGVEY